MNVTPEEGTSAKGHLTATPGDATKQHFERTCGNFWRSSQTVSAPYRHMTSPICLRSDYLTHTQRVFPEKSSTLPSNEAEVWPSVPVSDCPRSQNKGCVSAFGLRLRYTSGNQWKGDVKFLHEGTWRKCTVPFQADGLSLLSLCWS